MTADYLQILDPAIPGDHCTQQNDSLNARLPRQRRVLRLDAIDEISFHHPRDARTRRGWFWRQRHDGSKSGANRVEHPIASQRIAGAAGNT